MESNDFNPPLWLRGHPDKPIRTLEDPEKFLLSCDDRRSHNRVWLLHRLQAAQSLKERESASKSFKEWIEAEGLMLVPRAPTRERKSSGGRRT